MTIRSATGSHGIGSSGFKAMLIPNTAAPIASQNMTWNDQKIRLRHRGSESRSAVICGGATPVAFAAFKRSFGVESMGNTAECDH